MKETVERLKEGSAPCSRAREGLGHMILVTMFSVLMFVMFFRCPTTNGLRWRRTRCLRLQPKLLLHLIAWRSVT